MQYFTIKNPGICPIEGFTTLGVSSARGNESAIGQFGSGAKHGVLTCLRMGLNPVIYLGRDKIQFHTEPARLPNGTQYNKVFMRVNQKAPRELSMALEYGALDWDNLDMALREFVSNAIDSAEGNVGKISFKAVERIHPEDDCTVIGVPLTPEVQRFWQDIPNRFLQFAPAYKREEKILDKSAVGPAKVYRKGVYVRTVKGKEALFDYNFGEELRIDEARNLDDYYVNSAASQAIGHSTTAIAKVLTNLYAGKEFWEAELGSIKYYISGEKAQQAWKQVFGDNAVLTPAMMVPMVKQSIENKGYKAIAIDSPIWVEALSKAKVPTVFELLDNVNDAGHKLSDPTPEVLKCRDEVWDWLVLLGLTNNKRKPTVIIFQAMMDGGSETLGYYKDGKVYIGKDYQSNKKVMLEELGHYITGAADASRDFQDWAFRVAAGMMGV